MSQVVLPCLRLLKPKNRQSTLAMVMFWQTAVGFRRMIPLV
ncbi:hypothetical protein SLEP1_g6029 [Rubroshorea leprosula]|uniref:Uncharacterized protein n=1 Tax=Rubroshorea leprosula TaxID=152421 RepID=A0AAV5I3I5_9ROSI|nr:hypothetical protein SLEP1_g6029 [Rubroshorea leprosula]